MESNHLLAEIARLEAAMPGASHATAKQLQRRINELHNQLAAMTVANDEEKPS
ncbi:hypothetical protein [Anatilimnocola floriformis]|uniref:hypothetical protein n=1 Tax=Anatilimnocola floriformis TaxID=2948575 RepID=UPI0020C2FC21|nr:hypothetical protein [Anatilimnocola floriformis]